eukprot:CAMPEP_0113881638 /NCGR_PEP_ID=MMETSP0780_2-20120614/8491_1 /TAXON_ID=652834 /ORGANISM="Palpitomonas bilix" /LENGTH=1287 /DNA_ID=CAMNT_0000868525 /DNA_START=2931 /DNA_END=6793 /DNA_ORIENTATION=- /assembly_acc=CAM_ASM_000599
MEVVQGDDKLEIGNPTLFESQQSIVTPQKPKPKRKGKGKGKGRNVKKNKLQTESQKKDHEYEDSDIQTPVIKKPTKMKKQKNPEKWVPVSSVDHTPQSPAMDVPSRKSKSKFALRLLHFHPSPVCRESPPVSPSDETQAREFSVPSGSPDASTKPETRASIVVASTEETPGGPNVPIDRKKVCRNPSPPSPPSPLSPSAPGSVFGPNSRITVGSLMYQHEICGYGIGPLRAPVEARTLCKDLCDFFADHGTKHQKEAIENVVAAFGRHFGEYAFEALANHLADACWGKWGEEELFDGPRRKPSRSVMHNRGTEEGFPREFAKRTFHMVHRCFPQLFPEWYRDLVRKTTSATRGKEGYAPETVRTDRSSPLFDETDKSQTQHARNTSTSLMWTWMALLIHAKLGRVARFSVTTSPSFPQPCAQGDGGLQEKIRNCSSTGKFQILAVGEWICWTTSVKGAPTPRLFSILLCVQEQLPLFLDAVHFSSILSRFGDLCSPSYVSSSSRSRTPASHSGKGVGSPPPNALPKRERRKKKGERRDRVEPEKTEGGGETGRISVDEDQGVGKERKGHSSSDGVAPSILEVCNKEGCSFLWVLCQATHLLSASAARPSSGQEGSAFPEDPERLVTKKNSSSQEPITTIAPPAMDVFQAVRAAHCFLSQLFNASNEETFSHHHAAVERMLSTEALVVEEIAVMLCFYMQRVLEKMYVSSKSVTPAGLCVYILVFAVIQGNDEWATFACKEMVQTASPAFHRFPSPSSPRNGGGPFQWALWFWVHKKPHTRHLWAPQLLSQETPTVPLPSAPKVSETQLRQNCKALSKSFRHLVPTEESIRFHRQLRESAGSEIRVGRQTRGKTTPVDVRTTIRASAIRCVPISASDLQDLLAFSWSKDAKRTTLIFPPEVEGEGEAEAEVGVGEEGEGDAKSGADGQRRDQPRTGVESVSIVDLTQPFLVVCLSFGQVPEARLGTTTWEVDGVHLFGVLVDDGARKKIRKMNDKKETKEKSEKRRADAIETQMETEDRLCRECTTRFLHEWERHAFLREWIDITRDEENGGDEERKEEEGPVRKREGNEEQKETTFAVPLQRTRGRTGEEAGRVLQMGNIPIICGRDREKTREKRRDDIRAHWEQWEDESFVSFYEHIAITDHRSRPLPPPVGGKGTTTKPLQESTVGSSLKHPFPSVVSVVKNPQSTRKETKDEWEGKPLRRYACAQLWAHCSVLADVTQNQLPPRSSRSELQRAWKQLQERDRIDARSDHMEEKASLPLFQEDRQGNQHWTEARSHRLWDRKLRM